MFNVGMEAFDELLSINVPWSQEFNCGVEGQKKETGGTHIKEPAQVLEQDTPESLCPSPRWHLSGPDLWRLMQEQLSSAHPSRHSGPCCSSTVLVPLTS